MSYQDQVGAKTVRAQTVSEFQNQLQSLLLRINSARHEVNRAADTLSGAQPTPIDHAFEGKVDMMPPINALIERLQSAVVDLETAVERL